MCPFCGCRCLSAKRLPCSHYICSRFCRCGITPFGLTLKQQPHFSPGALQLSSANSVAQCDRAHAMHTALREFTESRGSLRKLCEKLMDIFCHCSRPLHALSLNGLFSSSFSRGKTAPQDEIGPHRGNAPLRPQNGPLRRGNGPLRPWCWLAVQSVA